jgi:hypothetical protein
MTSERQRIEELFKMLCKQEKLPFPQGGKLQATTGLGVYVIRKGDVVLYVGRTLRGKEGISQRLNNHLQGASSFTKQYLNGNGAMLRNGHTYQYLIIENSRKRALLEAYAIGTLCPEHIGLGEVLAAGNKVLQEASKVDKLS